MINTNLTTQDYQNILSGTEINKANFKKVIDDLIQLSVIYEGIGAPTQAARKHTQYFDTATSKYYRNTDGGTTWVALN